MIWSRRTSGSETYWSGGVSTDRVRWSSSERPLSVRTIWVDGVRHAILSLDDPLLHYKRHPFCLRPGSCSTVSETSSSSSGSSTDLEECLVKLRVALDSAEKIRLPPIDNSPPSSPAREPSPCPSTPLMSFRQNPLSERVLQWLDLANKGQPLATPLLPKRSRNASSCVKSAHAKRKLYSRSATIDVPASSSSQRKQSVPISTTSVPTEHMKEHLSDLQHFSSLDKEEPIKQIPVQATTAIVPQRYEPLRPLAGWPSSSKSSRPQLHIFIPSLQQSFKTSDTDFCDDFCSSYISE